MNHLILLTLVFIFASASLHAVRALQPAFKAAYSAQALTAPEEPVQGNAGAKEITPLHIEYFNPQVHRWESEISAWSSQTGLPPDLIAIVMQIESCGDQLARSSSGAMGIFQVMPFHFGTGEDPYDPQINALRGLAYLEGGYSRSGGRIDLTLAGYNGGHSMIETDPEYWPDETKRYVLWGVGLWEDIQAGQRPSPTLERWLAAGGARLCASAEARTHGFNGAN